MSWVGHATAFYSTGGLVYGPGEHVIQVYRHEWGAIARHIQLYTDLYPREKGNLPNSILS